MAVSAPLRDPRTGPSQGPGAETASPGVGAGSPSSSESSHPTGRLQLHGQAAVNGVCPRPRWRRRPQQGWEPLVLSLCSGWLSGMGTVVSLITSPAFPVPPGAVGSLCPPPPPLTLQGHCADRALRLFTGPLPSPQCSPQPPGRGGLLS